MPLRDDDADEHRQESALIAVRTALGQKNHLASGMSAKRTYCGLEFSVGYDETEELAALRLPEKLCQSCYARFERRKDRYG